MTPNRASAKRNCADEPHRRRPDDDVRLRPSASTSRPTKLKSPALQRPHRNAHGPDEPQPPVNVIVPSRSGPSKTVKSP